MREIMLEISDTIKSIHFNQTIHISEDHRHKEDS